MPHTVRSTHTRVKRDCAVIAQGLRDTPCENARMPKKHPIRPYLFAWRTKMGKSSEWLANELGTVHSTVLRHESGRHGVDDATFKAIAAAYGITVAELSAHPDHSHRARALHRLLETLPKLDDRKVERLADLAEDLKPSN